MSARAKVLSASDYDPLRTRFSGSLTLQRALFFFGRRRNSCREKPKNNVLCHTSDSNLMRGYVEIILQLNRSLVFLVCVNGKRFRLEKLVTPH